MMDEDATDSYSLIGRKRIAPDEMERKDQRGGALERETAAKILVSAVVPTNASVAIAMNTATTGTAVWMVTVGLVWQAQAQSAECAR